MVLTESTTIIKKGRCVPEFSLKDTDGNLQTLPKGLVLVVFMCNHCPYVIAKLDELNRIAKDFKDDLTVIGINANNNPNYPDDSYENMQEMVAQKNVQFTYVLDETQSVSKAYGAVCTPDPFLIKDGKLLFHSRIANPPGIKPIEDDEMYKAIREFLSKGSISMQEYPSLGCSIKWVE